MAIAAERAKEIAELITAGGGDVDATVSSIARGDAAAAAAAWSASPGVRAGLVQSIDPGDGPDGIAKGMRQRVRIARVSGKGNPGVAAALTDAFASAIVASGMGDPSVDVAPPAPPAPAAVRGASPKRPRDASDLLVGPRPEPEDEIGMMNWLTAQIWSDPGVGMEYPETVFGGDDAVRMQSLFSSDPAAFLGRMSHAGEESRQILRSPASRAADIVEAFPSRPDAETVANAGAALTAALERLSPKHHAAIVAAHGEPSFSPKALEICASVSAAFLSMRPLAGYGDDGDTIPLGDFGHADKLSLRAVLGSMMFRHLCGAPMGEAATDTLASALVRAKHPGREEIFSDEAWDLGMRFVTDPAATMRETLSQVENAPQMM